MAITKPAGAEGDVLDANEDIEVPKQPSGANPKTGMEESPQQECHLLIDFRKHGMEEPVKQGRLVGGIVTILLPIDQTISRTWIAQNLDAEHVSSIQTDGVTVKIHSRK